MTGDLWLCEGASESPTATPHLRRLSEAGARPEGGPDTRTLCMKRATADVRAYDPAWDHSTTIVCRLCLSALDSTEGGGTVSVPALGRAQRLAPVTRLPRPGLRRR